MGCKGASSGRSDNGKAYGTEYTTLYQSGRIKFVKHNESSATAPMETMTKGRIYVTVNNRNQIKSITYYDKNNKRYKQIDISGKTHPVNGKYILPHTHIGYEHDKYGTFELSKKEQQMVDRVKKLWYDKNNK